MSTPFLKNDDNKQPPDETNEEKIKQFVFWVLFLFWHLFRIFILAYSLLLLVLLFE